MPCICLVLDSGTLSCFDIYEHHWLHIRCLFWITRIHVALVVAIQCQIVPINFILIVRYIQTIYAAPDTIFHTIDICNIPFYICRSRCFYQVLSNALILPSHWHTSFLCKFGLSYAHLHPVFFSVYKVFSI